MREARSQLESGTLVWPVLRLLRPEQYIKNLFVLGPLLFSTSFLKPGAVWRALFAALIFCVASSAAYVFNDLCDLESDRQHPLKRLKRPLAAGAIRPSLAWAVLGTLVAIVLAASAVNRELGLPLIAYVLLNVAYSLRLKHVPVVDLFTVSAGFLLRVFAGARVLPVELSFWMFVTTLCLALFLAASKRRQELSSNGAGARGVLASYTVALLEDYMRLSGIAAVVFYGLFVATVRHSLISTVPLVLFGLFRYRYLLEISPEGESPADLLLRDAWLALTILAWTGLCVYGLWPR